MRCEFFSSAVFYCSQVLTHDVGARTLAFERHYRQHLVGVVANISSLGSRHLLRDPEKPKQSHDVIDPETTPVAESGADSLDERLVSHCPKLMRNERRKPPILATGIELIRRCAYANVLRHDILPDPRIRPVRIDANRKVLHQGKAFRAPLQLFIQQQLDPFLKSQPFRVIASELDYGTG